MNAIAVLYAASLGDYAFFNLGSGTNAFSCAVRNAARFNDVKKIALFVKDTFDEKHISCFPEDIELIKSANWNRKTMLEALCRVSEGYDLIYYAWADTPLLDAELAGALRKRLVRYAAEYAYADGWPNGLAPELLTHSTAAFLLKLNGDSETPVERDSLFTILQKDINAFDIETELSPVDLRSYRLSFDTSSKRNFLLTKRFIDIPWQGYKNASSIIEKNSALLRTLPAFFPVMVNSKCPEPCMFCPFGKTQSGEQPMPPEEFTRLLDKICRFAGDAVIGLSLWGELSLHPRKIELIEAILKRNELSLVIETCGIGWDKKDFDIISDLAQNAPLERKTGIRAISWIVSLDAEDKTLYNELHGDHFEEARACIHELIKRFPGAVYVQALRRKGAEDDIEAFYRAWNGSGAEPIIQKYDYFSGHIDDLRAGDISPLKRAPCWHIMRDFPIMLDGTVSPCREMIVNKDEASAGNAFKEDLNTIWERGEARYLEHIQSNYGRFCTACDEYYTYNF
ncbi:MAG: spiro-SPASM protein [Spirochaetaceae bacterium]|jgi:spiro-SPASM protein|nr:spiro-SPASM protein [Spirochaetaceae bacterium]